MKFAIRDDDTCYFTHPDEIARAYDFADSGVISLSVIPNAYSIHGDEKPFGEQPTGYYAIGKNQQLIRYLRSEIKKGHFEILLHGCTHEYKMGKNGWIPEMGWKKRNTLFSELRTAKKEMEQLLGKTIKTFVAPSNEIHQEGISCLEQLGLNYSGIIGKRVCRKIDAYYVTNYIKNVWSLLINHNSYGGVCTYAGHKELIAYPLKSFEKMKKQYEYCKSKGFPFVIYTHYWELNKDLKKKEELSKLYEYICKDGYTPIALSKCFED